MTSSPPPTAHAVPAATSVPAQSAAAQSVGPAAQTGARVLSVWLVYAVPLSACSVPDPDTRVPPGTG